MTTVLIADDHPLVLSGLRALLETLEGIEVVGQAADGRDAVSLAVSLRPDVVVMDLQMPELDGVEATRQIAERLPGTAVLVLTMHDDDASVFAAMRAGARGYLLKGAAQDDVARAIAAVSRGEAIFGPTVAGRLLEFFAAGPESAALPFPELTVREREILDLMAGGLTNAEIAQHLFLSSKTVSNNVSVIFDKLQVAGRPKAIVRARNAGLGRSEPAEGELDNVRGKPRG
ncbi:MAG: response regulator [Candidatus Limnocylindria bacterium]